VIALPKKVAASPVDLAASSAHMVGMKGKRRQDHPKAASVLPPDEEWWKAPEVQREYFAIGRALWEKMLRVEGLEFSEQPLERVLELFDCGSVEDLYVALGGAHFTARLVFAAAFPAAFEKVSLENVVFLNPHERTIWERLGQPDIREERPARDEKSKAPGDTLPVDESNAEVDEPTLPRDDPDIVDTAAAILAARAILSRVPPAERTIVVKALEENLTGGAAGGESAGTDDPATAKPRPETPATRASASAEGSKPAIKWPSEKWDDSDEKAFHKPGAIINYLRRVWKPFIKSTSALVTREILSTIDGPAEEALTRHLRYDKLPKDIGILYTDELKEYSAARPLLLREVPFING
jgi:hypothetical protein